MQRAKLAALDEPPEPIPPINQRMTPDERRKALAKVAPDAIRALIVYGYKEVCQEKLTKAQLIERLVSIEFAGAEEASHAAD